MAKQRGSTWIAVALIAGLCGCGSGEPESSVIHVDDEDPVITKAIADARATVNQFITALETPPPNASGLAIKMLVEEGDAGEHIWVSGIRYVSGSFVGQISNVPEALSSIKLGDTVSVRKDDISDWMYVQDGKLVGGYTIRALVELAPEEMSNLPFEID